MKMNKIIKFAIIGCGRIGNRHAEHISNLGSLVAVCDIDQKKANELGEKYNAERYTNISDLLEKESSVDVISICSPNGLHSEQTIAAF